MAWFFTFFFLSGFCTILYEIIWLRLAMAQFGVTTAMVSIVISMFMAGLGLGSWGAGRLIWKNKDKIKIPALRLYALIELLIGLSAIIVPLQLLLGRYLLEQLSLASSGSYYLVAGIWVGLTLIPWCACMGATIPVAMLAISNNIPNESKRSFSYLYLANVLGAVVGTIVPLLLIELYGFHGTLYVGAAINSLLCLSALILSGWHQPVAKNKTEISNFPITPITTDNNILWLLFASGLTSMGMEIVWIRQFTPYLGTVVYSFAAILGVYLGATYLGSQFYRSQRHKVFQNKYWLYVLLTITGLLPIITTDPIRIVSNAERLIFGIGPFSFLLGFITPMLVDHWSQGNPARAGNAYAINVLGCILGPLIASFILLPLFSERWVLVLFSLPWAAVGFLYMQHKLEFRKTELHKQFYAFALLITAVIIYKSNNFEDQFHRSEIRRDHTATIIATGDGFFKQLLVNGYGMTMLVPMTKVMAHLPLAFLDHQPQNALVVCFGMGTTFRSLLSWNIDTTAVELVPGVPSLFKYYHADGAELLQSPLAHVVIDDGRRYLERTRQQYDVITIDPPPPIEAAASSLLYSTEFYTIIKKRLKPNGIFQQWLPMSDVLTTAAVTRAISTSFPYVRIFNSVDGGDFGLHFIASLRPLPNRTASELAQQLPPKAVADFIEWGPTQSATDQFNNILTHEHVSAQLIAKAPDAPILQDDRPVNEYYMLRRYLSENTNAKISKSS